MKAWAVHGVALPFGDEPASWWIDGSGAVHDRPVAGADPLPGGFVLPGLVDAQAGITLVRDVGSPGGLTLQLGSGPGMPALQAAGRFLAPAGPYFPDLLDAPVDEAGLVAGTDAKATYRIDAIARLVAAAHEAGARVAEHSTVPGTGQLVAAGVDSVEHGFGLDERAVRDMADRGTAWTPTAGALLALLDAPDMTPQRRHRLQEGRARIAELLPLASGSACRCWPART
jgi:imidazolonepropionase-like amidohydrolase